MYIADIIEAAALFENRDIFNVLSRLHIGVQPMSTPLVNGAESLIIGDKNGTLILIGPNKDDAYRRFLLWHELGHFVTDASAAYRRNFMFSEKRLEHEMEANIFAVLVLMPPTCPPGENMFTVAKQRGIPPDVLRDVMYRLRLDTDPTVAHYFDSYYK